MKSNKCELTKLKKLLRVEGKLLVLKYCTCVLHILSFHELSFTEILTDCTAIVDETCMKYLYGLFYSSLDFQAHMFPFLHGKVTYLGYLFMGPSTSTCVMSN
jgi:hypothetical protein